MNKLSLLLLSISFSSIAQSSEVYTCQGQCLGINSDTSEVIVGKYLNAKAKYQSVAWDKLIDKCHWESNTRGFDFIIVTKLGISRNDKIKIKRQLVSPIYRDSKNSMNYYFEVESADTYNCSVQNQEYRPDFSFQEN